MKAKGVITLAFLALISGCGKDGRSVPEPKKVEIVDPAEREEGTLRVLYWNIQNGMWYDQDNEFRNFREFVKKYAPDVCVWCEAQSIYKSGTSKMMAAGDRYFPDGWPEFSKSYGHDYTAIGGYRLYADDYYPQVVTSKYPIETVLKITETDPSLIPLPEGFDHTKTGTNYYPVAHGAALQRIRVGGKSINFVTLHLWPHAYSYYAKYVSKATSSSSSKGEGNIQREKEITYICQKTYQNPEYASEKDWLMLGDFNTRSPLDNWYYGFDEKDPRLSSHDYILNKTTWQDIIALKHPGKFFMTRTWVADGDPPRYDFMYASPSMYARVVKAEVIYDLWCEVKHTGISNYYTPSDHYPILVDFKL